MINRRLALFLDIDGTLLDVAPTPDAVQVPPWLPELLSRLSRKLGGALALISGRDLIEIDRLFAPHRFWAAGAHGCELRLPVVAAAKPIVDRQLVAMIHESCRALPHIWQGVLVEYKSFGAAIHYRLAPQVESMVAAHAVQLLQRVGPAFELQAGKCVYELKPAGFSKGTAISELMSDAPFATRRPVFIGDDATDEYGFEVVNNLCGLSIKVGHDGQSNAMRRIATPAAVQCLLTHLTDQCTIARTGATHWSQSLSTDKIEQS